MGPRRYEAGGLTTQNTIVTRICCSTPSLRAGGTSHTRIDRGCFASLSCAPVCRLTKHVDEEQLGDIPVAELGVFLLERRPDSGTFLRNDASLLGRGLARPHGPYQLTQPHRHGGRSLKLIAPSTPNCKGKPVSRSLSLSLRR